MSNKIDFSKIEPNPEMIEEAKNNPNGWVYVIVGNYDHDESVPPEAIAGAWEVDDKGEIIQNSFKANPNYVE